MSIYTIIILLLYKTHICNLWMLVTSLVSLLFISVIPAPPYSYMDVFILYGLFMLLMLTVSKERMVPDIKITAHKVH